MRRWISAAVVGLVFWWAFAFRFVRPNFQNDHFEHLAMAQQVLSGEYPDRDFFAEFRPLTVYASAAVQRFSPTLLGELILTTTSLAAGAAFVSLLARDITRSTLAGVLAALFVIAMKPRLYGYPKILLLPFGLWLLWRYIDRPSRAKLAGLAAVTVVAALFRYDYGLYLGITFIATLLIRHRAQLTPALVYVAITAAASSPYLIWLAAEGHLWSTASWGASALTHSVPGVTRTPVHLDLSRGLLEIAPPPPQIGLRWRPDTPDDARRSLETRWGLHERGKKMDGRTMRYFVDDATPDRLLTIIGDPNIEDTSGVDRHDGTLQQTARDVWQARVPLLRLRAAQVFPSREDAKGWLYYVILASPLAALVALVRRDRTDLFVAAKVTSAALLGLLIDQFLLRGDLNTRLPEVAAPAAILIAWVSWRSIDALARWGRPALAVLTAAGAALGLVTWCAVESYAKVSLSDVTLAGFTKPSAFARTADLLSEPPIDYWTAESNPGVHGLTRYVARCLAPDDRLLLVSYAPDVFYVSQRLFAGGMSYFEDAHFSSPSEQRLTVKRLRGQSVPLVVVDEEHLATFRRDWPLIERYVMSRYREAAALGFGDDRHMFHVLVDVLRHPVGAEPQWGLPCFQGDE